MTRNGTASPAPKKAASRAKQAVDRKPAYLLAAVKQLIVHEGAEAAEGIFISGDLAGLVEFAFRRLRASGKASRWIAITPYLHVKIKGSSTLYVAANFDDSSAVYGVVGEGFFPWGGYSSAGGDLAYERIPYDKAKRQVEENLALLEKDLAEKGRQV